MKSIKYFKILFLFLFLIPFQIEATITPQIYFTDIKLEKNSFQPGETVKGTVSLGNYENSVIPDLRFQFQLLGKEINGVPTEMIDAKIGEEVFSLSAGEKTTKNFSYLLPQNF